MHRPLAAILVIAALSACASGGGSTGPRRDRNLITAEEIASVQALTAYEAVQRLRPHFLRRTAGRGSGASRPVVYLDRMRLGGPDELNQIRANQVVTIRYLDASDATTRFGTGHTAGAILVSTRATGGGG